MTTMEMQKLGRENAEGAVSSQQDATATEAVVTDKDKTGKDEPSVFPDAQKPEPPTNDGNNDPWSIWSTRGKRLIIFSASLASLLSPLSIQIYFPALEPIAKDLQVSDTLMNLPISTCIILQRIAPTFSAQLSDTAERRPIYLVCLVLFLDANLCLGAQNSYPALLVLRCFQSAGSSGIAALSNAVAADVATPAERGSYVPFAAALPMLAMALVSIRHCTLARSETWQADTPLGTCDR
jgi:hypothetical protein